ncbi:Mini-ribonuclease 3 [Oceanirhabdus sp. W0125-5]|uniref:Mini-ribonuclease 3 n=1 Tax=Oceanirhabdus sp. W0125-5 TaxID=2999116 RepID=UPI0022F30514|nr:ribonuclease III domain-containing protein [Oceanirhabdus sp. W0125-5]WBW97975.1 ribonuclease III domain-containing protein [Oceanirhabdus sp. W0125-5]
MNFEFLGDNFKEVEAKQMNSLTLAFIGDSVFEIIVRSRIIKGNMNMKVKDAHKKVIDYVKATSQCKLMKKIEDKLNDDEMGVYKRGRNCKSISAPKSANITEYRVATGFEALIGYLYLVGKNERIGELMKYVFEGEI